MPRSLTGSDCDASATVSDRMDVMDVRSLGCSAGDGGGVCVDARVTLPGVESAG